MYNWEEVLFRDDLYLHQRMGEVRTAGNITCFIPTSPTACFLEYTSRNPIFSGVPCVDWNWKEALLDVLLYTRIRNPGSEHDKAQLQL